MTLRNTLDATYMSEISKSKDGGLLKHRILGRSSGKHTNFSYYFALKRLPSIISKKLTEKLDR